MENLLEIRKESGISLSTLVTGRLRDHILKNCTPGQKILSERNLSEMLGISRVTTGKAISSLVSEGLLYQTHGSGTYVAERKRVINRKIGVIVYHSDNPFYGRVVKTIQIEADKAGFHTILINSKGNVGLENTAVRKLMSEVDGFIVAPALTRKNNLSAGIGQLIRRKFPVVIICHTASEDEPAEASSVVPDYNLGGYMITEHLIEKGYRKIMFLAVKNVFHRKDICDRFEGYKEALAAHGMEFNDDLVVEIEGRDEFNGYFKDGYRAAGIIIPKIEKDTAVFSIGDSCAIGLMRGLREKGLAVPGDVGVCGFDDIDLASQWGIELTTVKNPTAMMGKEATRIIVGNIQNPENYNAEKIICPMKIVVRKSA